MTSAARRYAWVLILVPLLVGATTVVGGRGAMQLAVEHPRVALAEQLAREESGLAGEQTKASETFRMKGGTLAELTAEVRLLRGRFRHTGYGLGLALGLVMGFRLLLLAGERAPAGYEPDRGSCVSCVRCVEFCPVEKQRRVGGDLERIHAGKRG